ncbi:hypothetical protein BDB01DRAFT_784950 [Pilobolus umbonatus]|nr:hypothetical protein BDB01DRAFT_784950 [Pilobolus umbonatus]
MPSEKFRITTNGQSLRNTNNCFFGMTLSSNMTVDESDLSAHNDRRSAHNALERQRREHLNIKFQQLAHALPSLQTVRRPSKTMIVSKSLEFVSSSLKRENNFMTEIQKLRKENEELKEQAEAAQQKLNQHIQSGDKKENESPEILPTNPLPQTMTVSRTKSPLKRKSSDESQPSPPPTPKALKDIKTEFDSKKYSHKRRMVQQTKPSPSPRPLPEISVTDSLSVIPSTQVEWSPLHTGICTPLSDTLSISPTITTTPTSTVSTCFEVPLDYSSTLMDSSYLFMDPTSSAIDVYSHDSMNMIDVPSVPSSYDTMMNPMLLAPYYVPVDSTNISYSSFEQRDRIYYS